MAERTGREFRVALAGNPNSGKTTLFNALTGARQHVGNYPGVTVEIKEGRFTHDGARVLLTDLPGTYSLTAHSDDEKVARDFILDRRPDLIVDVVDASNLERNLYLATQFLELEIPVVLAFNMWDVVESRGHDVDTELLSRMFGVPIARISAHRRTGLDDLKRTIVARLRGETCRVPTVIPYGREVEAAVAPLAALLAARLPPDFVFPPRCAAVKAIEGDEAVLERMAGVDGGGVQAARDEVERARSRLQAVYADDPSVVVADRRYGFISGACREAVRMTIETRRSASDRIDEILTSRVLGVPAFLLLMYLMFRVAFSAGAVPMGWIEAAFAWAGGALEAVWPWPDAPMILSLLRDGVLAGVGGVLVFTPTILILFLAIALLEDTGYMARAAFIMDSLMHRIGLHGKSFIPMLIGFGCTVPALMATRMLSSRRDRLSTMLVLPLFSCGARLPIYTLFIGAFFEPAWQTPMLMTIYMVGVVMAVLLARLLRSTLFSGETEPLVMDLPPYRVPTLQGLFRHTWDRTWLFVRKAGTTVVGISILLWFFASYPKPDAASLEGLDTGERAREALQHSMLGRVGRAIEPVMRPVGFDWQTSTALLGAIAAKEVFVAQLGILHALSAPEGEDAPALSQHLRERYTRLQAFSVMLFCLMSVPCVMTMVAMAKESGSWWWAALQFVGLTLLAYAVTLAVYQGGLWLTRLAG